MCLPAAEGEIKRCETPCTLLYIYNIHVCYMQPHTQASALWFSSRYRTRSIDAMNCVPSTWPNWNVEDFVPAPPRLQSIFTSHAARGPIITQPPPYTSKLYLYSAVCERLYIYILYTYTRPNRVDHRRERQII